MFKKNINIIIIFISITTFCQNNVTLFSKEYKISPKINIPLTAGKLVTLAATDFNKKIRKITGEALQIERSNSFVCPYSNYYGYRMDCIGFS